MIVYIKVYSDILCIEKDCFKYICIFHYIILINTVYKEDFIAISKYVLSNDT